MSRKVLQRTLGCCLLVALCQPGNVARAASPERQKPPVSFLLVTLDTTRADHLGAYGASGAKTPNLDAVAREGVLFRHAYATTPVTLPSHASILTGLIPPRHGVRNNGTFYLDDGFTTLAELLRDEGFATAAFVSAAVLDRRYGLDQGFDHYDDGLEEGKAKELRMVAERTARVTVHEAVAWLEDLPASTPFFLWVHVFDPHLPYEPPAPFATAFAERPYDGEIAFADAELGRLLRHPRVAPRGETLVVVLGDHGESLGEHGETSHALLAYDSTLRIPWIVRAPDGLRGVTLSQAVSQVDLAPTALDLLSLEELTPRLDADGRSVAKAVGHPTAPGDPRPLYAETLVPFFTYGWAPLRTLRDGDWKLIEAPTPELYHLPSDPGELHDVAARHPVQVQELLARLGSLAGPLEALSGSRARLSVDAATRSRLRSLGYLAAATPEATALDERPDPKAMISLHPAMERAQALLFQRRFDDALDALRPILRRDPNNLAALKDTATALGELERWDEALRVLSRALRQSPRDPGLHLALATLHGAAGRPAEALEEAERALELDPRFLDAQIEAAGYLALLDRDEEARKVLRSALEETPLHPRLNTRYAALVEIPRGQLAAAEARLRRAVAREPYLSRGWELLGVVLERSGRPREAVDAYRRGLGYQPREAELHARLGLLLRHRESFQEAETHLRRALALSPSPRPDLHNALGDGYRGEGRESEARREYAAVLALTPASREDRHERARALYASGRLDEAEETWRALLGEDPRDALAQSNLASLALQRQDWPAARRLAREAVANDPTLASAWNNLGIAREELARPEEALAAYGEALQADPTYWQAAFNRGLLLRKLNRFDAARRAFETVLQWNPGHAKSHYELGLLHGGPLHDPETARSHLEASLAAEPHHPRAEHIRKLLASLPPASPP